MDQTERIMLSPSEVINMSMSECKSVVKCREIAAKANKID